MSDEHVANLTISIPTHPVHKATAEWSFTKSSMSSLFFGTTKNFVEEFRKEFLLLLSLGSFSFHFLPFFFSPFLIIPDVTYDHRRYSFPLLLPLLLSFPSLLNFIFAGFNSDPRVEYKPHDTKKPSTLTYSIGWIRDIDNLTAVMQTVGFFLFFWGKRCFRLFLLRTAFLLS
jgi:hypothetical protein